tara:strand:- start:7047 stop:9929 length:2883 start_codon:yes stop_codon:yes gene_type:complete
MFFGVISFAEDAFASVGRTDVTVAVTGVSATSALGNETVTASALVTETGVVGTTSLGSETVTANATFAVTGLSSTSSLGNEGVTGSALVAPSGSQGVGNAGSANLTGAAVSGVSGVGGTGTLGDESVVGTAVFSVTGVAGTTSLGNETVSISKSVEVTGVSATSALGSETVTASATVSPTGVSATGQVGDEIVNTGVAVVVDVVGVFARANEDLGGALNAEYFVPTDTGNPNLQVRAFEASTTVSNDSGSLGTISSAGGNLSVSASNYENNLISANKPIIVQTTENSGVPTSWAGTRFAFHQSRVGVFLSFRSLSGTANVTISKDGSLVTSLTVADNTTTTQSYSDDTSDPQYHIVSDVPIIAHLAADTGQTTDTRPLFPSTGDALYGIASNTGLLTRDEGYSSGATNVPYEESDGTTGNLSLNTFVNIPSAGSQFRGAATKIGPSTSLTYNASSFADFDGGQKTSFIPEGCFANEFYLPFNAEFIAFVGAANSNGGTLTVFNSSGTQLGTKTLSGTSNVTKAQIVASNATGDNLAALKESYQLDAGTRIVSTVPVGAFVEDLSTSDEENLLGLRTTFGLSFDLELNAIATPSGVSATGAVGNETVATTSNVTVVIEGDDLQANTAVGNETVTGTALVIPTGANATSNVGSPTIIGAGISGVTGQAVTGNLGDESVTADANVSITTGVVGTTQLGNEEVIIPVMATGVDATGSVGNETVVADSNVVPTGVEGTTQLGDETVLLSIVVPVTNDNIIAIGVEGSLTATGTSNLTLTGEEATGSVGDEEVSISVTVAVTGQEVTASLGDETVFLSTVVPVTGEEATTALGNETVTASSVVIPTGAEATSGLGDETIELITSVDVTGVSATGVVLGGDNLTFALDAVFSVTGLSITGNIANVLVYGLVVPDQTTTYSEVTVSQTPSYNNVTGNTANYSDVAISQNPSYSTATPSQNPDWDEEAA